MKIQVWLCEQTDLNTAVSAATRAWQYLTREFGQVKLAGTVLPLDATVTDFEKEARALATALPGDKQDKFQILTVNKPEGTGAWASVHRDPKYGYYVFLFFAKP